MNLQRLRPKDKQPKRRHGSYTSDKLYLQFDYQLRESKEFRRKNQEPYQKMSRERGNQKY